MKYHPSMQEDTEITQSYKRFTVYTVGGAVQYVVGNVCGGTLTNE